MRVLILSANYSPEPTGIGVFSAGLAEHLTAVGHGVTVAATVPHFPQLKVYEGYAKWGLNSETINGVNVLRGPVWLLYRETLLGRLAYDGSLALGPILNLHRIPRPDVIVTVSPPIQMAFVGAALGYWWRAPTVLWIQDLVVSAGAASGVLKNRWMQRIGRRVERTAYRLADQIVVISGAFANQVSGGGIDEDRIREIPNWSDVDFFAGGFRTAAARKAMGARGDDDFVLVHAGNMSSKMDLANSLSGARRLLPGRLRLCFVGDGSERASLQEQAAKFGISDQVTFLPLQPRSSLRDLLASADALLVNQQPGLVDSVVPSKLLTYLAAGRPVLAAVHPESQAAKIVLDAQCGVVVAPGDPEAFAHGAAELMDMPSSSRNEMGNVGRDFVQRVYARSQILSEWTHLIQEPGVEMAAGSVK